MVRDMGGEIRSAYPLADQPIGTSVPFMPQARPWNVRSSSQRPLEDHEEKEQFAGESVHPAALKPVVLPVSRKTASVTENQGFVEQPIQIKTKVNFQSAGRTKGASIFKGSHVRDDVLQDLNEARKGPKPPRDEDNVVRPAIMWFVLGIFIPFFLLCGVKFLRSMNTYARRVGYLSLFLFVGYILAGLIIFVQYYTAMYRSGWSGSDPSCVRYMQGSGSNFLNNPLGSAFSVYGISALGLGPTANISLYELNCGFVLQVPVSKPTNKAPFQTMYVRVITPGTSGDDFGTYGRNRPEGQLNRFTDPAPALAWFQWANPYISNPYIASSGQTGRPPCKQNMCSGVYQKSAPELNGIQYDIQVQLGSYDYQMVVGIFAMSSGALERAFCVDTCGVPYIEKPTGSGNWVNPCLGLDITTCPQASSCILAKTRADCLGLQR